MYELERGTLDEIWQRAAGVAPIRQADGSLQLEGRLLWRSEAASGWCLAIDGALQRASATLVELSDTEGACSLTWLVSGAAGHRALVSERPHYRWWDEGPVTLSRNFASEPESGRAKPWLRIEKRAGVALERWELGGHSAFLTYAWPELPRHAADGRLGEQAPSTAWRPHGSDDDPEHVLLELSRRSALRIRFGAGER